MGDAYFVFHMIQGLLCRPCPFDHGPEKSRGFLEIHELSDIMQEPQSEHFLRLSPIGPHRQKLADVGHSYGMEPEIRRTHLTDALLRVEYVGEQGAQSQVP